MGSVSLCAAQMRYAQQLSDYNFKQIQIERNTRKLTTLSSVVADGRITFEEMSTLDGDFQGLAMNYIDAASKYAMSAVENRLSAMMNQTNGITLDVYQGNSELMQQMPGLEFNENGYVDEEAMRIKLFEQAKQEFIEKYVMQDVKRMQDELENELLMLKNETKMIEGSYGAVEQGASSAIGRETIRLTA